MNDPRKSQKTIREHARDGFRRGILHASAVCDLRAEQLLKMRVYDGAPRAAQLQAIALELRREAERMDKP